MPASRSARNGREADVAEDLRRLDQVQVRRVQRRTGTRVVVLVVVVATSGGSVEITFRLNGTPLSLSSSAVEQAVAGVEPEPIREHAVIISGRTFPMKQPFALATGLDRLDFTTNQARTQLRRLGFEVVRVGSRT